MKEIHISDIPHEIADNIEFLKVLVFSEIPLELLPLGAVADPPEIKVKTYRIIRGHKPCQP